MVSRRPSRQCHVNAVVKDGKNVTSVLISHYGYSIIEGSYTAFQG